MPELPEMANLARQMNRELKGKVVAGVEVRQPKVLNGPEEQFRGLVLGKAFDAVRSRGKWVMAELLPDAHFLLSLGMGGEALYHRAGEVLPERYQVKFTFSDGDSLTINFWWFGYAHAVRAADLGAHRMTAELGLSPLDDSEFTYDAFTAVLEGRKGGIKSFLMDQKNIAGIGNVYIQEILWNARLHPNRRITDIEPAQMQVLFKEIRDTLRKATDLGGLIYERDLYDQKGRYEIYYLGAADGKAVCPMCGAKIEKLKSAGTPSYICPTCQK
jgi:formamidopyrimidine-DNA glycosylase